MSVSLTTYIARSSCVHRLDARVKILLLIAYTVVLFLMDTWIGMAVATVLFFVVFALSTLPASKVFGVAWPVYVLVAFAVLFNSVLYVVPSMGNGVVDTGLVPLAGGFSFTLTGFLRGCFFALRILLLVFASLIVCFSTTATQLTRALVSFMRPLRKLHVPVDDVATVFSIALRFIPVTAEEFERIRDAQWSRGASFYEGGPIKRMRAWATALIPLFANLFRRADRLALAMDMRCYGMAPARTSLHDMRFSKTSVAVLVTGLALCAVIGVL